MAFVEYENEAQSSAGKRALHGSPGAPVLPVPALLLMETGNSGVRNGAQGKGSGMGLAERKTQMSAWGVDTETRAREDRNWDGGEGRSASRIHREGQEVGRMTYICKEEAMIRKGWSQEGCWRREPVSHSEVRKLAPTSKRETQNVTVETKVAPWAPDPCYEPRWLVSSDKLRRHAEREQAARRNGATTSTPTQWQQQQQQQERQQTVHAGSEEHHIAYEAQIRASLEAQYEQRFQQRVAATQGAAAASPKVEPILLQQVQALEELRNQTAWGGGPKDDKDEWEDAAGDQNQTEDADDPANHDGADTDKMKTIQRFHTFDPQPPDDLLAVSVNTYETLGGRHFDVVGAERHGEKASKGRRSVKICWGGGTSMQEHLVFKQHGCGRNMKGGEWESCQSDVKEKKIIKSKFFDFCPKCSNDPTDQNAKITDIFCCHQASQK
ncbi:hypothetical protein BDK51DRAFT_29380 [Blyttiomyces helicus]|uniref:Uncharacterized protein n=1 Tax=Blyttiomyces helicus TaxID=388810 RepID=A0A4P9WNI0_9FUNG|nr:hypothetical protein BDK51DRAFT_29380 [Blyttiomyces helicus]|eukprot:RKO93835.1 hypothetical protein BDK51DRAFT_29380 [Blyttiomyces helicus]